VTDSEDFSHQISIENMEERSYLEIRQEDLARLSGVAQAVFDGLFVRKPELGIIYAERRFALVLAQGAAQHYVDGMTGIKDFDVWGFFDAQPKRQFPPRWLYSTDFGDPRFGTSPDKPKYIGRRVDVLGRSLDRSRDDIIKALCSYLQHPRTKSAWFLSQKAMVMLEPKELLGKVIWLKQC
jgi:hypothetical protein